MSTAVMTLRRLSPLLFVLAAAWSAPTLAQPPGGFSGGYRPDPNEIVDRLDENRNGQIDPDEMQGRARFFLEGLIRDNGLDVNKSIGKDKLRDMLRARWGGSSGSSSGSSSGNSSSSNSDRYRPLKLAEPVAPTVPGFGIDAGDDAPTVPGFGPPPSSESWDVLKQKYNDRVIEEVEEALERSDRNRDGVLDYEELKTGRWRGDPKEYDKNKDGKLQRSELALRYQDRESGGSSSSGSSDSRSSGDSRFGGGGFGGGPGFGGGFGGGDPRFGGGFGFRGPPGSSVTITSSSGGSSTSSGSSGGSSSSSADSSKSSSPPSSGGSSSGSSSSGGSSSSSGNEIQEKAAKMADQILRIYDADKNNEIGKDEMGRVAAAYKVADYNGNGVITKDELAKYALGTVAPGSADKGSATASTPSSSSSGGSSSSDGGYSRSSRYSRGGSSSSAKSASNSSGERRSYRFLAATERLPQGLPDWFATNDADGDGQIAMSEFSQAWDEAKAKEFAQWDHNGDGLITPGECLKKSR